MVEQTIKPWPFHQLNLENDFRYGKIVSHLHKFLSALVFDLQSLLYRFNNGSFICCVRIGSRHIRPSLHQRPVNQRSWLWKPVHIGVFGMSRTWDNTHKWLNPAICEQSKSEKERRCGVSNERSGSLNLGFPQYSSSSVVKGSHVRLLIRRWEHSASAIELSSRQSSLVSSSTGISTMFWYMIPKVSCKVSFPLEVSTKRSKLWKASPIHKWGDVIMSSGQVWVAAVEKIAASVSISSITL